MTHQLVYQKEPAVADDDALTLNDGDVAIFFREDGTHTTIAGRLVNDDEDVTIDSPMGRAAVAVFATSNKMVLGALWDSMVAAIRAGRYSS